MTLTIIPGTRANTVGEANFASGALGGAGRVQTAIANAAASTGTDFQYLYHQAKIESGLNPNARASTSSASGLYQFTTQTWLSMVKQHGAEHGLGWAANAITRGADGRLAVSDQATRQQILALRQDPDTAAAMAGEYAADNRDYLQARLGRDAGSADLYMAHFLGPAGASRFLSARDADGAQSAAALMPTAASANRWVFFNKDGTARSLDDVYQRFASRFGEGGTTPSPATATPATATRLATRATDTAAEVARMQLAALDGTTDDGMTVVSEVDTTAGSFAGSLAGSLRPQALLTPSPRTARLAYLMLASMGVS